MKALLQRVTGAAVHVADREIGRIGPGLLVFLGFDRDDDRASAECLLERLLRYRVFADERGRMNRSVVDAGGGVLLVSQFTLSAATDRGLRPSFSRALAPAQAERLFAHCVHWLRGRHPAVASGEFGADMRVSLVNDGPVTFLLEG